jgi:hypothetical protein
VLLLIVEALSPTILANSVKVEWLSLAPKAWALARNSGSCDLGVLGFFGGVRDVLGFSDVRYVLDFESPATGSWGLMMMWAGCIQ